MGLNDRVLIIPYLFCLACVFFIFNPRLASAQRLTYIVHMDNSFMPKPFITQQEWYFSIVNSLKPANQTFSDTTTPLLLYTYNTALHGFSVLLSPDELQALRNISGVISAYSDKIVTLDTTHSQEFLSLSPSIGLWPASSYGEDVIIGIIDSGVWPESESFKGDGMTAGPRVPARWNGTCQGGEGFNSSMCNSKLIGARYYNKSALAAHPSTDVHVPYMNSARDNLGHGTQTSSIAAGNFVSSASFFSYANGTAKGVAPRAKVAVYKVYWDVGGYASDVLTGINQAIADGVVVLSISMGFDGVPLYEDPIAIASFAAMERGMSISTSAGNGGVQLLGSLHNGIPWVLTVAVAPLIVRLPEL